MKKFLHAVTALIVTVSTLISPLTAIKADGMIIKPDPYDWEYYQEGVQQVYINYENGRQNMILSVGMESGTDNLVWIFPVPASPDKVVIDNNTAQMPNLNGYEISSKAEENIGIMEILLSMNQIYPAFALPLFFGFYDMPVSRMMDEGGMLLGNIAYEDTATKDQVQVFEHIENRGMATELLTSDSAAVLQEYFDSKSLKITAEELESLTSYFGEDYTFVVSWMTSQRYIYPYPLNDPMPLNQPLYYDETIGITLEEDRKIPNDIYYPNFNYLRGLYVSFPTNKMYFPLIPTSVYGSDIVPAIIKVIGLVTPDVYDDIKSYTRVTYHELDNTYGYVRNLPDDFISQDISDIKNYTTITINAPSKLLTEDLYFSNHAPLNVYFGSLVNTVPVLFLLIPLIVNSMLASTMAAFLVFKEARSLSLWKYTLWGLTNILSLVFTTLFIIFFPTRKIKEEDKILFTELNSKGYNTTFFRIADLRKLLYLPLFSIFYLVLTFVGGAIMKWLI